MATPPLYVGTTWGSEDDTTNAVYTHNGGLPAGLQSVAAVQNITLAGATTGTFDLWFGNEITAAIPFNASTAAVDAALEALPSIPAGGVTVTGAPGNWTVTFTTAGPQPQIFIDTADTDGDGATSTVTAGVRDFFVFTVHAEAATIPTPPAGWTYRADALVAPGERAYTYTKLYTPGDVAPTVTLSAHGGGRHFSTLSAWRGVDPTDPVNAVAVANYGSTALNTYTLPQANTTREDSTLVYSAVGYRNSSHSWTWSGAQERFEQQYAPPSLYTPGGWFSASSQYWYSMTVASLTKSALGLSPAVYATINGGSASQYWCGAMLALSPVPVSPPPPEPPPAHPDCVSANFANGSQLSWGRPVQGIYFDQAAVGNSVVAYTTPGAPGTLMYDQNITWTNDTGLPLLVTPTFVHGTKQVLVLDPIQAYVDEYWAMTSGAAPATPVLPGTESNKFGGGSDSSEGCVFQFLEEDIQTYTPFGQFTVPNGHQVKINYQCRLSTVGTSASSAISSQWAQVGSHRIILLGEVLPDPALP